MQIRIRGSGSMDPGEFVLQGTSSPRELFMEQNNTVRMSGQE